MDSHLHGNDDGTRLTSKRMDSHFHGNDDGWVSAVGIPVDTGTTDSTARVFKLSLIYEINELDI